eukprot:s1128_g15.t2
MSQPTPAPWMDTQLVLPGQTQLSTPPAATTLSMPRPSEESLQERLRSLETECQQLRDSNSRLELENSKLKQQVSSSQGLQPRSEKLGSPSRLNGSISVAETQHQVLRNRMRAMMEEQKRLVDELQREIAEEMSQLQVRPNREHQPMPLASTALTGSSRSGLGEWPSARAAPRAFNEPREAEAPPEGGPLGSRPTVSQPWSSWRVPESTSRTSSSGDYIQSVPDELNAPCEAEAPPEEDSPAPPVTKPMSRMSGSGSGRPLSALKRVPPLDLPERYMQAVPDKPHSPWEVAAPPEGEPPSASFASSARLQKGGAAMPEEPNAPSEAARAPSKSGSDVASIEAPPEDEGPPKSNAPGDPPDEKPQPMMSKSPVQGSAGKAEHADATQKSDEKRQVLQEGVILLQRYDRKSSCFQLRLCNKKLANLNFTVDISKSVNLELRASPGKGTSHTCNVPPGVTVELCQIGQVNPKKGYTLRATYSWVPQPADRKLVQQQTAEEVKRRHDIVANLKTCNIVPSKFDSAAKIEEACSERRISQFIDAEFFPDDAALFKQPLQFAVYGPLSRDQAPEVLRSRRSDERELVEEGLKQEVPSSRGCLRASQEIPRQLTPGEYFVAVWTPDKAGVTPEKDRTLTLVLQLEEWGKGTGRSLATLAALWKPQPLMSKSPVQGSAGKAEHADPAEKSEEKKKVLQEGVILLQRYDRKSSSFQLRLCNKKLANLNFTVDISKSVNLELRAPPGKGTSRTCNVEVPPGLEVELCQIVQVDPKKGYTLSASYSWVPEPADRKLLQQQTAEEVRRRHDIVANLQSLGIVPSKLVSAAKIEEACSKRGISQFIDAEFFPDDAALFKQPWSQDNPCVVWKRPSEFCDKGEIRVFSDSITPCDIHQGALGDCWYLAALAAVAEQPQLIRELFSSDKHSSLGVYEVSCFKNGQLTKVIVDDLIPCSPSTGKPCYAHVNVEGEGQTVNELWVALLEKAWAKLHGSYEQIEGGIPYQALMDLLGAAGKRYQLKGQLPRGFATPDSFFQALSTFDTKGYVMVAGTNGVDNLTKGGGKAPLDGLVPGHAYTLLTVREACGVRLVRLRNPWGDHEWTGDWSDKSACWTQKTKQAFDVEVDDHDGAFWMSDGDFLKHFSCVDVAFFDRSWATARSKLTTIGASMCNQLLRFEVNAPARGFLSLLQNDHRIKGSPSYMALQFAVYGPLSRDQAPEVLRSRRSDERELVEEIPRQLTPGEYFVAVWTPDKEKDRTLTLVLQLEEWGKGTGRSLAVHPTPIDGQQMGDGPLSPSWSSQMQKLLQTMA